jgi:hypothetical protein
VKSPSLPLKESLHTIQSILIAKHVPIGYNCPKGRIAEDFSQEVFA